MWGIVLLFKSEHTYRGVVIGQKKARENACDRVERSYGEFKCGCCRVGRLRRVVDADLLSDY